MYLCISEYFFENCVMGVFESPFSLREGHSSAWTVVVFCGRVLLLFMIRKCGYSSPQSATMTHAINLLCCFVIFVYMVVASILARLLYLCQCAVLCFDSSTVCAFIADTFLAILIQKQTFRNFLPLFHL